MRRFGWRWGLAVVQGLGAVGLLAWQRHNGEVIAAAGMRWDTGAPVWPYQAPEILMATLHLPAMVLVRGMGLLGESAARPILEAAMVAGLWFGVGWAMDGGWFERRVRRGGPGYWWRVLGAAASLGLAGWAMVGAAAWAAAYGDWSVESLLVFLRVGAGATLWLGGVAWVLLRGIA